MLNDQLLEQLRHKGESHDLDYKVKRYAFANATDDEKSELLKDVLAMANTHRSGTAYILMGFAERTPDPAEAVGLSELDAIDDSRLQQFINDKLAAKLTFKYEERMFSGKRIAVLSIPKQKRPFYLTKPFGKVPKDTVFVRRGSATAIASPNEVAMMGATDIARGDADVDLVLLTIDNEEFPTQFAREFVTFPENLPNYGSQSTALFGRSLMNNEDYWREAAAYHTSWNQQIQVRIALRNHSDFALGDAHLEVTCASADRASVDILRADDLPEEPSKTDYLTPMRSVLSSVNQKVKVDERTQPPIAHIELGTLRPGQTVLSEADLALIPTNPGHYSLQVRIFANEIPSPLMVEHQFEVTGIESTATLVDLYSLMHPSESASDNNE